MCAVRMSSHYIASVVAHDALYYCQIFPKKYFRYSIRIQHHFYSQINKRYFWTMAGFAFIPTLIQTVSTFKIKQNTKSQLKLNRTINNRYTSTAIHAR